MYKSIRYSEITFGIEKTILVSTIFLSFVFNEATLMVYASLNEAHKLIIYSTATSFLFILLSVLLVRLKAKSLKNEEDN